MSEIIVNDDLIQVDSIDTELKEKIKTINSDLEDTLLNEIVEKSKQCIITDKSSFNQCMDFLSEYFHKDLQNTKTYIEFLCEKTNIPLQFIIDPIQSVIEIPPIHKHKISSENFEKLLQLKKARLEEEQKIIDDNDTSLYDNYSNDDNNYYNNNINNNNVDDGNNFSYFYNNSNSNYNNNMTQGNNYNLGTFSPNPFMNNNYNDYPQNDYIGVSMNQSTNTNINHRKKKIKIKCRDWPSCKNINCPFIHPKDICPFFPHCSFGEKCYYIHPMIPCKFGKSCTRMNCPYIHSKF